MDMHSIEIKIPMDVELRSNENKICFENIDKTEFVEKISVMPFQNQLWILASLPHKNFIQWSTNGLGIFLDIHPLNEYLKSLESMFQTKDSSEFLQNLMDHGFQLVKELGENQLLEFRHKYFLRDRMEYLCMIFNAAENLTPDKKTLERRKFNAAFRMKDDLCLMIHGSWTKIQQERAKFKTNMEFKSTQDLLTCNNDQRKFNAIPIPVKLYKTPMLTVLAVDRDDKEYMGFYGDPDKKLLNEFIGENKPKYMVPENLGPEHQYYASHVAASEPTWFRPRRFANRYGSKPQSNNNAEFMPDGKNSFQTEETEVLTWEADNMLSCMETTGYLPDNQDTKDDVIDEVFEDDYEDTEPTEGMDQEFEIEIDEIEHIDDEQNWLSENDEIETENAVIDLDGFSE